MRSDPMADLRADCSRCVGLCCVALPFTRSADFPVDKAAGTPCPHLAADDRCRIHDRLRPRGYTGCTVFDCFGAGQRVTARFAGSSWRHGPDRTPMFEAFASTRGIAEMRWYLREITLTPTTAPLADDAGRLDEEARVLADGDADDAAIDGLRTRVAGMLREAGRLVREETARGAGVEGRDRAGADLVGARLAGSDLRAWDLRGALLLGADLTGADLGGAVLLGADLRGAELSGANLASAFAVTSPQVAGARGDTATLLPEWVDRPAHWA